MVCGLQAGSASPVPAERCRRIPVSLFHPIESSKPRLSGAARVRTREQSLFPKVRSDNSLGSYPSTASCIAGCHEKQSPTANSFPSRFSHELTFRDIAVHAESYGRREHFARLLAFVGLKFLKQSPLGVACLNAFQTPNELHLGFDKIANDYLCICRMAPQCFVLDNDLGVQLDDFFSAL